MRERAPVYGFEKRRWLYATIDLDPDTQVQIFLVPGSIRGCDRCDHWCHRGATERRGTKRGTIAPSIQFVAQRAKLEVRYQHRVRQ